MFTTTVLRPAFFNAPQREFYAEYHAMISAGYTDEKLVVEHNNVMNCVKRASACLNHSITYPIGELNRPGMPYLMVMLTKRYGFSVRRVNLCAEKPATTESPMCFHHKKMMKCVGNEVLLIEWGPEIVLQP